MSITAWPENGVSSTSADYRPGTALYISLGPIAHVRFRNSVMQTARHLGDGDDKDAIEQELEWSGHPMGFLG